ncbi:prenyltransferase/squalene oxidase repeat-containing protein [Paenibacillus sp. GYB004]|uniref:prenyltransferase/squalene oxidase repeat-containing protein n=1 Tax=Paenibacillus sp. GYB004 TaxID=2994393 RepID=UPI002F96C361
MTNHSIVDKAGSFLYSHARLLDRKRYEYHFERGTKEAVIQALRAYQNADGGFGNALEPDIRDPHSQPVPTEMALLVMEEIDCFDPAIMEGIAAYVRTITLENGGLPLIRSSVHGYAHTPWWSTEDDRCPSMNPTGTIIGLLYKHYGDQAIVREHWFEENVRYIWSYMESNEPSGFHDGTHWIQFLQHTPDTGRAAAYWRKVDEWLGAPGVIEKDPHASGYVQKVLDWAPQKESYAGKFVSGEDKRIHLKALAEQQQEDGGWPISWQPPSIAAEQEWRGFVTVERLKTLKSYGVL